MAIHSLHKPPPSGNGAGIAVRNLHYKLNGEKPLSFRAEEVDLVLND